MIFVQQNELILYKLNKTLCNSTNTYTPEKGALTWGMEAQKVLIIIYLKFRVAYKTNCHSVLDKKNHMRKLNIAGSLGWCNRLKLADYLML